jgi:hypothetical protein
LIEGLVEVVHLDQDADDDDENKAVGGRMRELIVAVQRQLESNSKSFNTHYGNGSHKTTNRNVNQRCPLSIPWYHPPDHKDGKASDKHAVCQEG